MRENPFQKKLNHLQTPFKQKPSRPKYKLICGDKFSRNYSGTQRCPEIIVVFKCFLIIPVKKVRLTSFKIFLSTFSLNAKNLKL